MIKLYILFIPFILAFNMRNIEPVIGKWSLLYSTNKIFNDDNNDITLNIVPSCNSVNKFNIKILISNSENLLTTTKIICCYGYNINCNEYECSLEDQLCSLIIVKSEKYIKSFGILELPQFIEKYNTNLEDEMMINWKINPLANTLYIDAYNYTYIFERIIKSTDPNDKITTNPFIISNIISFLLGKLLEKFIHNL